MKRCHLSKWNRTPVAPVAPMDIYFLQTGFCWVAVVLKAFHFTFVLSGSRKQSGWLWRIAPIFFSSWGSQFFKVSTKLYCINIYFHWITPSALHAHYLSSIENVRHLYFSCDSTSPWILRHRNIGIFFYIFQVAMTSVMTSCVRCINIKVQTWHTGSCSHSAWCENAKKKQQVIKEKNITRILPELQLSTSRVRFW